MSIVQYKGPLKNSDVFNHAGDTTYTSQNYPNSIMTIENSYKSNVLVTTTVNAFLFFIASSELILE